MIRNKFQYKQTFEQEEKHVYTGIKLGFKWIRVMVINLV